jgi:hypothetical protein
MDDKALAKDLPLSITGLRLIKGGRVNEAFTIPPVMNEAVRSLAPKKRAPSKRRKTVRR